MSNGRVAENNGSANKWMPVSYFILGQAGWFACVLSAARGVPWIGALVVTGLIAVHLLRVAHPVQELRLVACVVGMGGLWDSALVRWGLLDYPSGMVAPGWAPYWIVALWALFAAQINASYRWLKQRLVIAALLGASAGPLSFRAGAALGALHFVDPWTALLALATGWAALLPAAMLLARRWDGAESRRVRRRLSGQNKNDERHEGQ